MDNLETSDRTASEEFEQCYPVNCWWVAAIADEVTSVPISRQLLQKRVALVRNMRGIVALEDCCPHRRAPLSLGRLVDDEIECAYHGFRFNGEGRCTRVPSDANSARHLSVRSYPVEERGPFVWIWMGDPRKADRNLLPNIEIQANANCLRIGGHWLAKCNYMLLFENFMDVTHFPFVHANCRRPDISQQEIVPHLAKSSSQAEVAGNVVIMSLRLPAIAATDLETRSLNLKPGATLEKNSEAWLTLPSCFVQKVNIISAPRPSGPIDRHTLHGLLCVTPISPSSCHVWGETTQDYGAEFAQQWQEDYETGMREDIRIVEAIQPSIEGMMAHGRDVLTKADHVVIVMRKALRKLLQYQ